MVSDENGGTDNITVNVTLTPVNDAPIVVIPINDQELYESFTTLEIDMTGVFSDPENNPLTITAISSNEGVVMVSVLGTTLTLTEVGLGNSTITVTASDGSLSVNDVFEVTINDIHFVPVWWPGNGTDHMNFYALTAKLDGVDLQPGDEIGIFDGDICVGVGVLTEVLNGSNYLSCIVSKDDPAQSRLMDILLAIRLLSGFGMPVKARKSPILSRFITSGDGIFARWSNCNILS